MAPFQMRFGLGISPSRTYDEEEEEDDEEEEFDEYDEEDEDMEVESDGTASPPPPSTMMQSGRGGGLVGAVVGALRRSLVMCTAGAVGDDDDEDSDSEGEEEMEIGRPVDVRHVAHVTFDRFGGFLGLPADLEHDVPRPTPSVSASVFGVSPTSLQCSYDQRGNSVPIILLMMQKELYLREGLKIEGIFRINGENSQEACVRDQLNSGVVPNEVDLHCLAGLIKVLRTSTVALIATISLFYFQHQEIFLSNKVQHQETPETSRQICCLHKLPPFPATGSRRSWFILEGHPDHTVSASECTLDPG